jgi:hypothetical protein
VREKIEKHVVATRVLVHIIVNISNYSNLVTFSSFQTFDDVLRVRSSDLM